jgi:predicted nucleic acid-binding protein
VAWLFLDANVFPYTLGADSPHRAPCRDVLQAVGRGKLDGITSSAALQEILHSDSSRFRRPYNYR